MQSLSCTLLSRTLWKMRGGAQKGRGKTRMSLSPNARRTSLPKTHGKPGNVREFPCKKKKLGKVRDSGEKGL